MAAAVVVLALVGCGGASNRAASEIDKHATLASWKPQLPHDEKQRIDDCLGNAVHHPANPLISQPGDPALVPFLPHLVYFSIAEYDLLPGDDVVDVTVYIFDSPSTAARWVLTVSKEPGPRNIGQTEVRRVGSVVSYRWATPEAFGAYRDIAFTCSTA